MIKELDSSTNMVFWDCKDSKGNLVDAGEYIIKIADKKNHKRKLNITILEKK